jgi:hypothetical protein
MISINVHRLKWCLRRMPGITDIKYLWLQKHIGVFLSHVDDNFAAPVETGGLLVCIYKQITPGERFSLSIEVGDEIRRYKRISAKSPFYLAKVKDVLARKLTRRARTQLGIIGEDSAASFADVREAETTEQLALFHAFERARSLERVFRKKFAPATSEPANTSGHS